MKSRILTVAAVAALLSPAGMAFAQDQAQPGSIHGHVQNAAGQTQNTGDIKLTTDRSSTDDKTRKYDYSFPVDAEGNYKGSGIKPGKYVVFYIVNGKSVDYFNDVEIKPGADTLQDDDMSREEFLKSMTPEQRKQLEDYKKQNAAAVAANKAVANLNALLSGARDDEKAGKYDDAIAKMQQATTQKPDEALLWLELGNAQLGAKKFDDAATSLQKAADLNAASKKPNPSIAGSAYNNLGQALIGAKKPTDALAAYDKAAAAEPTKAGVYYYNEAAVLYNAGNHEQAAQAADKAITADPTKADAYYIKGQSLIDKAALDPKTQKMTAPDGCLESYLKYLELAPNGSHAADVQGIVSAFDEKQVSAFKAARGKKK